MEKIKEILKAVVLQPLSVGNTRESGERGKTDANVSSAVLFASSLAIILVLVYVFGPMSVSNAQAKYLMWSLTIGLVLVSLLCVMLLTFMIFRNKENWVDMRSDIPDPATRLKIKFLWLFGCGMILQTSLTLAINVECLQKPSEETFAIYHIFSFVSSMLKIIYVVWQMGFVTYLQNSVFVSRKLVNYSVAVMVICNLSLWGKIVSDEITNIINNGTDVDSLASNNSLDGRCYLKSEIYAFSVKIKPYLIPVRIEYLLLSSLFVFRMWPTFRVSGMLETLVTSLHFNHERERMAFIAAAVCGSVTNLPFFIQTLLMATVFNGANGVVFEMWHCIVTVHNFINLLLIFICFYLLRRTAQVKVNIWHPGASEYILLLTNTGQAADDAFGIIAASGCYCPVNRVVQTAEVSSILQAFFQTIFILHSVRYEQRISDVSSRILRFILIYLFISNLSFWFTATFIGLDGKVISEGQSVMFKDRTTWGVLQVIVYPLFMFFRFHSAMYFFSLFHRFSWKMIWNNCELGKLIFRTTEESSMLFLTNDCHPRGNK